MLKKAFKLEMQISSYLRHNSNFVEWLKSDAQSSVEEKGYLIKFPWGYMVTQTHTYVLCIVREKSF